MALSLVELIAKKRDGGAHEDEEIARLVSAFVSGELADYQMSAWLMATYLRGMSTREAVSLTHAMLRSGLTVDLSSVPGLKVDKHSTGGVGDKVSICLAPLVAACGVPVPMVSGRGLGHTGGTLDKLEAIPGFRTDLSVSDFVRVVGEVGTCMIGQTSEIAPADKRMYALRDVTATVESIPLIVASILSKKLAEGIDGLVLDVKVGRGAFMRDLARARELAEALVRVGTDAGKRVTALLTDMDAPLGHAVGNAIETREAILVLHGKGPADLVECTLALGAEMLLASGKATTEEAAREELAGAIASGQALRVMERMVVAQGGDPRVIGDPSALEVAEGVPLLADEGGFVQSVDALEIGLAAVALGAGRTRADQRVDPAVGITVLAKPGAKVARGEPLAFLHVRRPGDANLVRRRVELAFRVAAAAPPPRSLVLGRVGA
jgi:pyrimidine-nucleoside phosphorylase